MKAILAILCLGLASCGFRHIPANPAITGHAAGIVPTTVGYSVNGAPVMGFAATAAARASEDREASQARSFYGR